jgi:hypothetical protein
MPKITPRDSNNTVHVKTMPDVKKDIPSDWWNSNTKSEMCQKLLSTVSFLKEMNQAKYRQASIYARMYGNLPLVGWVGSTLAKMNSSQQLPYDRPTMSVVTSCVDTLVSKLSQSKPVPSFLTSGGDYKQRKISDQINKFIKGEFYQTKAYELGVAALRDACVLGTGVIKILEDRERKVCLERRIYVDLLVDPNDSFYGAPRQLYELKLVDRSVLMDQFPRYRSDIEKAQQAYPDNSGDSSRSVSDTVMVVEGWHLKSGPDATDGIHTIACSEGILLEEKWEKKTFPFSFLNYSNRLVGLWGQGIPERQMGTQVEINKLLMTMSSAINLVGVPRVFVEDGSKIVKAHLTNNVGAVVTYRGTKPIYEVAPCVPAEMYEHLQRLINYCYQSEGISQLAANAQKPSGLTAAAALREYNDIQSDRFAELSDRYEKFYNDIAYKAIDLAIDIAKRDGSYQTIYPDKNGTQEIELPDWKKINDPFVIECYDISSLPNDPAGRLQKVTEMMQAGIVSPDEGRRLLNFPDIESEDKLAIAAEERILKILDDIVEEGKYTPPDPFMRLDLAEQKVVQYYNLYASQKLEEEKLQLLRNFFTQIKSVQQQAMPQPMPGMPQGAGAPGQPALANPMPLPQSDLLQNARQAA